MTASTDLRDALKDAAPSTLFRIAGLALLGHAFFSAFSAFAFATFLAPPYPEWLQTAQNQKVMAVGFALMLLMVPLLRKPVPPPAGAPQGPGAH